MLMYTEDTKNNVCSCEGRIVMEECCLKRLCLQCFQCCYHWERIVLCRLENENH